MVKTRYQLLEIQLRQTEHELNVYKRTWQYQRNLYKELDERDSSKQHRIQILTETINKLQLLLHGEVCPICQTSLCLSCNTYCRVCS